MDVPKLLVPKGNNDKRIEALMTQKKDKAHTIKCLDDLILKDIVFDEFLYNKNLNDDLVLHNYDLLDLTLIDYHIGLHYAKSEIHIFEFKNKVSEEYDLKNIIGVVNNFNEGTLSKVNALFKDEYMIFIYTFDEHYDINLDFIDVYKKVFGFEKVKAG